MSSQESRRARMLSEIEKSLAIVREADLDALIYEIMKNHGFSEIQIRSILQRMEMAKIIEISGKKVIYLR